MIFWYHIQTSINQNQRLKLYSVKHPLHNNYGGNWGKYSIFYIGEHQVCCYPIAVWRRGTSDQKVSNTYLPIPGVGSERDNWNMKVCIFKLIILYQYGKLFVLPQDRWKKYQLCITFQFKFFLKKIKPTNQPKEVKTKINKQKQGNELNSRFSNIWLKECQIMSVGYQLIKLQES